MKKLITICILLGLIIIAIPPTRLSYAREATIPEIVEDFATQYGVDKKLALAVVECESEFKPTANGDGGLSKGVMQYQKATFERHETKFGEDLNYNSSYDQIKLAMWAISQGYGREWTAYRAYTNGGTYHFYSRQLKKEFTVTCR